MGNSRFLRKEMNTLDYLAIPLVITLVVLVYAGIFYWLHYSCGLSAFWTWVLIILTTAVLGVLGIFASISLLHHLNEEEEKPKL